MTTDTWTASGIGNWTTGSDWSLGAPPTSSEDAYIGSGSGGFVGSGANETVNSVGVASTYTLDINTDSMLTATTGTGQSQSIFGTIAISDGSAFKVGSGVANFGTIDVESAGNNTNFILATNAFVVLSGGGNIEFDGQNGHSNFLAGQQGSELINEDNDISGTGTIFGAVFTNQGIVETNNAWGAGTLRIWGNGAGGGSFDNERSMFVDPGGTMILGVGASVASTIGNAGTIQLLGANNEEATLEISGNITIDQVGGQILLQGPSPKYDRIVSDGSAATLNLEGGLVSGGGTIGDANLTLNIGQGTVINADSSAEGIGLGTGSNTITNDGELEATNPATRLLIASPVSNANGTILAADGGLVEVNSVVTGGNIQIGNGSAMSVVGTSGGNIAGDVQFTGPNAVLYLYGTSDPISGPIGGAALSDEIDLASLTHSSAFQAEWQQNGAGGTLSVMDGATTEFSLTLSGQYTGADFSLSAGIGNSTLITLVGNSPPPSGTTAAMIMRDGSNGDYEIYDLGNNSIMAAYPLGQVGTEWRVAGVGAFDAPDTADMVLRSSNSGAFEIYDISGNTIANAAALGQVGLEWSVAGFGDFSGNAGETDMMMRRTDGTFEVYDISNNAITNAVPIGQVGTEWSIAGFGDFATRPNESDMLLRNVNTGAFELYDISKNQLTSAAPMGQVGLEWSVAGFGDFSGKANETDMLMRNSNTGAFEIYDIDNNAITSAAPMGQVGLEWQVAGFGPIGAAGESDMLMRNTNTGAFEVYDIANNQITNAAPMGQVGLEWQVGGIAADPPGSAAAQLAQAMAAYAAPGGALDSSAPFTAATTQPSAPTLFAAQQPNALAA